MTAQIKEKIILNGEQYLMYSEPLEPYLIRLNEKVKFDYRTTGCWRGYIGTWTLKNNRLYLIDLEGTKYDSESKSYREVGIEYLFLNQEAVFAKWFSGQLEICDGELINTWTTYADPYENILYLKFEKGVLTDFRTENAIDKMVNDMQAPKPKKTLIFWQRMKSFLFK